jgi:hypothetical protein
MTETVEIQYFAWRVCNKLHFEDIRKEKEKGQRQWLAHNYVKKV